MNAYNIITLDLRQQNEINLIIDAGIKYSPMIEGIRQLDEEYSLTFQGVGPKFTVSNGKIVLVQETKTLVIHIEPEDFPARKTYKGVLISRSRIDGIYFKASVNVTVS